MAINVVSVQYNGGSLPDIILLTQGYYHHWGTHLKCHEEVVFLAGSSEVPRNPLTRWDVSSIPANGIFLTKKIKK